MNSTWNTDRREASAGDQGNAPNPGTHSLPTSPLFAIGHVVATRGAVRALDKAHELPSTFLRRHVAGDWGDLEKEDRDLNDQALREGSRILSAYWLRDGTRLWVITEADRSVTTLLLPEEY
jgi:hypothetical protein